MSIGPKLSAVDNDAISKTPDFPLGYILLPYIPFIMVVAISVYAYQSQQRGQTLVIASVVVLLIAYFVLRTFVAYKREHWRATWRQYTSTIESVKTESARVNHELVKQGERKPDVVTLSLSNGHQLLFTELPSTINGASSMLMYEARHVNGELEYRNVKPTFK